MYTPDDDAEADDDLGDDAEGNVGGVTISLFLTMIMIHVSKVKPTFLVHFGVFHQQRQQLKQRLLTGWAELTLLRN